MIMIPIFGNKKVKNVDINTQENLLIFVWIATFFASNMYI